MKLPEVEFEVLTAVAMKDTIFLIAKPCSSVEIYGRFGGAYRLQSSLVRAGFLLGLFVDTEDGDSTYLRNAGGHATTQKIVYILFKLLVS
jgi:hypothetical protein